MTRLAPWYAAAALALAGCNATMPQAPAAAAPAAMPPVAAVGSPFTAALRCMDTLLLDHGVRDLSLLVEDVTDKTARQPSGAKEMLLAAITDMTHKSRAIRVVASGADWNQTATLAAQQGQRPGTTQAPQYALRGTVRALDASGPVTTIGLDLQLLHTQDMSLVPGGTTHQALALRTAAGGGLQAEARKFGQRHLYGAEGPAAAVRPLVELAAIDLVGRVARVPYWSCLGAGDSEPSVAGEIQDWYDTMASRPAELVRYFQYQLRTRRVYDGPIDGAVNASFRDAVVRTRDQLGLTADARLTLDFYKAWLSADPARLLPLPAPVAAPTTTAAATAPAAAAPAEPLSLRLATLNDTQRLARGEAVQLTIRPSRDAHVYCFLQDEKKQITRFFPNRFQRDSRVAPAPGLQLPGSQRFEIAMNPRGVTETVACFATERDVMAELPAGVNAGDFAPLPVASLDQVRLAFVRAAAGALAQDSLQLKPR